MTERLSKFVKIRIDQSLNSTILHDYGNSLWICDPDFGDWYFEYQNNQSLIFNSLHFDKLLEVFSIPKNEKSKYLREWFEKTTKLHVRSVERKGSDLSHIMKEMMQKKKSWDLKNRHGFPYEFVKFIVDNRIKSKKTEVLLENLIR